MFFYRSAFSARIIAAAICAAALLWPGSAVFCEKLQQTGVVRVDTLNMRSAPDVQAPVVSILEKDTEVRILQEQDEWLQVIHNGNIGYLYNDSGYLERYTTHRVTEDSAQADRELAMARAREIERRISQKQKELREVSQKQEAVAGDLEETDAKIRKKRKELRELMEDAEETSARILRLEQQAGQVREAIERREKYFRRRMQALYKLYRLGGMNLLAAADSVHDLFTLKASVERVLWHDEEVLSEMAEKRRRLSGVLERLNEKRQENQKLAAEYENSLSDLAAMKQQRKKVLAGLEKRKSDREQTISYLREASRRMDKTIKDLKERSYKAERDFESHQGLLNMPVKGNIVSEFGRHVDSETGAESYKNGIEINSGHGEPVRAVFDGETVFADEVRGFGRVVIVSHGSDYHTVYARVEDMFSSKGETVESGQVIATVGESGSRKGPALYFEIRHDGKPVDPMKWLDKG
ncbi:MAG: peptidoglycan DD-metalloendopeptidase family protein [Desulfobacterales bacterium]